MIDTVTCNCSMRKSILGDGCEICNPQNTIMYLKEEVAELEAKLAKYEEPHKFISNTDIVRGAFVHDVNRKVIVIEDKEQ